MDIRDLITPTARQEKAVRSPAPVSSPRPVSRQGDTPTTSWSGCGSGHGNGTGPRQTPGTGHGPQTPSTPGIDALVEAAHIKRGDHYETNPSSSPFPIVPPAAHSTPTPRPSAYDGADGSADAPRRDFTSACLSPEAQRTAMQLYSNIQKNHYAYEDRVNFIRLLHQGFVDHIYPPASPDSHGDPHRFDVLKDLKAAREELDSLFAIGEDLWAEWIQDESLLARTVNERIAVMELCRRSVEEEYGSTKLWVIYGEWMLYLYKASSGDRDGSGRGHWSDEDRIIGREVFTWQSVVEVWKAGADATRWRINDSHLVWNRYLELLMQDVDASPSQERVSQLRALFESRLQTPHAGWDDTSQLFSNFVSKYYNSNYEDIMVDAGNKAAEAKAMYSARESREAALHRAFELKDTTSEWSTFQEYIEWETSRPQRRKGQQLQPLRLELITSLYQRAVLRFPTDATIWEDYVMFLIDESMEGPIGASPIPAIERATRHCPWSGALWSQLFVSAERAGLSFAEILELKHKATRSGLLDAAGINEVLKVHTTWCSYLRRWALQPESTDEDLDVAEVGIRSAIESVQELGDKTNKAGPNDPLFHLERIYIRYLSARGSWDSAREEFKNLIPRHGHSFEFWLAYYTWELLSWSKFMPCDSSASASRRMPNPSYATAVLKQALQRTDLDWPEKIMDAYISHCEHYEDADESQLAIIDVRKAMKALTKRRQREAMEQQYHQHQAPASQQYHQPQPAAAAVGAHLDTLEQQYSHADGVQPVGKRKRGNEPEQNGLTSKKAKGDAVQSVEAPVRDREHASVIVKNLPKDIPQVKIRQFFRDCGKLNCLQMLPGEPGSALLEFDTHEDALAAGTKNQKFLEGNEVTVEPVTDTTVFVTNFPPTADENYIRELFHSCGEIAEVRFPSLKYNTHRRFCYVQFTSSSDAYAATGLNEKDLGGNLRLVVKISDPSQRQVRSGAYEEGREIYVCNLPYKTTEGDLVELFTAYGDVESVRIPTKVNGETRGFAFVTFATKDQSNAALAMNEKTFKGRELNVRLSTNTGAKRHQTTVVSRSESPATNAQRNGTGTPSTSPGSVSNGQYKIMGDRRLRTVALMNIPDTVNDARIRALTEPYGALVKIILRPDHQGAIVEFSDTHDAGKASLALEGYEITPGRFIRVVSVKNMLQQKAEHKIDRIPVGKEKGKASGATTSGSGVAGGRMMQQPSAPIRRPNQPSGGRRGGLGVKRGGSSIPSRDKPAPTSNHYDIDGQDQKQSESTTTRNKTNDDFRAMLSQPK
ncbi:Splicing factor [Microsporum canis]|uniref:U4/U6 snRNA-associated-splicing factor PRP24 n=1 Tax=Arthroderma otae (strain ATCC MYA-4605 / CBS 113480) TaxID=554155 RepID=C5G0B0_ARTOC|nr:U4/U6 snRNA-associated-splicing factor PRP24 [Microsporum canis CBS 113480]EEQ35563.1 U4/U6 snRNA-associated-splicing factor PRP24 [Microsporum canis CBS 113480]